MSTIGAQKLWLLMCKLAAHSSNELEGGKFLISQDQLSKLPTEDEGNIDKTTIVCNSKIEVIKF